MMLVDTIPIRRDKTIVWAIFIFALGWGSCAGYYNVTRLGWLEWRSDTLGTVQQVAGSSPTSAVVSRVKQLKEAAKDCQPGN